MNQRVWVLGAVMAGLLGCTTPQTRLQSEDESDRDKEPEVKVVRDVTDAIANTDPIQVSGVGLVVGLDGTGGGVAPGPYRQLLEEQLIKRNHLQNVKEILASPTTALVLVSAQIPAGAHKGDVLDVAVTVPRDSRTTSLRGGQLVECVLYNYDTKKALDPKFRGPDGYVRGHPLARAAGHLVVGFGNGDDAAREREGRIWGGASCGIDRPFYVILKADQQYAQVVQAVAEAVNLTFQGAVRAPTTDLAVAKTRSVVWLNSPPQYRLNLPRYLRVVRLIPLWDTPDKRIAYRRRLEQQLLDPAHAVTAALRLEALGKDSEPTLKKGLTSPHPLVRFCAAEALAYLGSPSCGTELARTVEQQPALRAFSLTALASLDEAVCHIELRNLWGSTSAETRYGAFRALRALDENDEAVQGELLNDSYWLHRVAPNSSGMIHISSTRRAEIVLFGEEPCLIPPFPIVAGEFTVTAGRDDDHCTLARTSARHGRDKRQCSLKVEDVLHTLADMGGTYGDAVDVLRKADHLQCLTCKLAIDALPQAISVYDLAKAGAGDPELKKTHPEILDARGEFGATPTLFERDPNQSGTTASRDEAAAPPEHKPHADKKNTDSAGLE
jgi:hypothetical protein